MKPQFTDAEIIRLLQGRERRWLEVLAALRRDHETSLGHQVAPVQWLAIPNLSALGWLGYYWVNPAFWFGFGMRSEGWLPLIEGDVRRCDPGFMDELCLRLPGAWGDLDKTGNPYWRLWAPAGCEGQPADQLSWFIERSHELHEFAVPRERG